MAQEGPPQDPAAPERGVARISVMNGEVSVKRGDSGDWVAGIINAPLMVDDRVAAGANSRAEVQFDSANLIRIGANAEVRIAELGMSHYHLQIGHGTVTYRVLRDTQAQVEVDTPTVSVRPLHVGAYRIYVQEDGQTEITVRLGSVEVATPKGTEQVQAGQTMLARGNPADPEFQVVNAIAQDAWDRWNEQRDHEMLSSESYRNVPQDMYGAEDMDNHGRWVQDSSYGQVWSPTVDPDWAPYQNGRWVWEDYYGWTWVSYDPWGWAPFHYGRWFFSGVNGWCWYPGAFGRHYWSPAMVAFFGYGPGVGVGFGFGNVGWVALAPFEPVYAWWGHGFYAGFRNPAFYNHGALVSNVSISNVYRNARVANGISSVTAGDFRQGRFGNIARTTGSQVREAGLVRGQLPVAPTAASLRFSNRAVTNIPRSAENVHFFGRSAAAQVQRVPFAEQQRAMQQFSRQAPTAGLARSSVTGGANTPWRNAANPVAGAGQSRGLAPATGATGGWRPVNEPSAAAGRSTAGGWQRFGEPRPASRSTGGSEARSLGSPVGVASPVVRDRVAATQTKATTRPAARTQSTGRVSSPAPRSSAGGGGSHGGGHR